MIIMGKEEEGVYGVNGVDMAFNYVRIAKW